MSEIFSKINWVDAVVLILLLRISYVSLQIGVGKQILPLILLALFLSFNLHSYERISAFFIEKYGYTPSTCAFMTYFIIALVSFVVYRIILRLIGCYVQPNGIQGGTIEKVGGLLLGIMRSIVIIGIILIGMLLLPIKEVEKSVENAYTAKFFITANLRLYSALANMIPEGEEMSSSNLLGKFWAPKKTYLFKSHDKKKRRKSSTEGFFNAWR